MNKMHKWQKQSRNLKRYIQQYGTSAVSYQSSNAESRESQSNCCLLMLTLFLYCWVYLFNLSIALQRRFYRNTGHIHVCFLLWIHTEENKYCHLFQQGLHELNVIDWSEVWKRYIRQFENWCCDNQTMIVPVQHVSLSNNNPCTSALTVHKCTVRS